MTVYAIAPELVVHGRAGGTVSGRTGRFHGRIVYETPEHAREAIAVVAECKAWKHVASPFIDAGPMVVIAIDADWNDDTWTPPIEDGGPLSALDEMLPPFRRLLRDARYEVLRA